MDDKTLSQMNAEGRSKLDDAMKRLRRADDPEWHNLLPPARLAPVPICDTFTPYRPFPSKLKFYPGMDFNLLTQVGVAHLGDKTNHKMFAVSGYKLESGSKYDGRPRWILHNGPNSSDPALAMISEIPEWGNDDGEGVLTLPSTLPLGGSSVPSDTSYAPGDTEFMWASQKRSIPKTQRYTLMIPLLDNGEMKSSCCGWTRLPEEEWGEINKGFSLRVIQGKYIEDPLCMMRMTIPLKPWKSPFKLELTDNNDHGDKWPVMAIISAIRAWELRITLWGRAVGFGREIGRDTERAFFNMIL
ncbi:hypothetical protein CGLO_15243 [Colletotrichum gloeosporioides Cg-14]|uniref:Uncharacterized protein n=1 Tax=Colletotrichum gloeosporioides (strain Cg-14) TaxID=1237896 RepID=T0JRE2_COLGC|nr:hypothetical protein CGLO_15243 [Colletotrichum gloeosporioides Cg-14]